MECDILFHGNLEILLNENILNVPGQFHIQIPSLSKQEILVRSGIQNFLAISSQK